ncbi:HlyC/CorC family transporter [Muribaculaceae bacterium Isolate-113 (HZI)]|jgi:CBS domain containing-hemolysin-like protein|uniref:hemolysin family protein n=1 Tax=Sangeribacter muris TaxID=2880703 RepID=UPI000F488F02|nr:hemolysin family protein [Sangeribacter muris]ROT20797.1 HlyC/CorC family transporter [Muribaculaceae bacterium Isolate-114 (HZI)]ROT22794.1 HlyC/CorC family transporter [Muribaculaceae bacterium Isolate-113 (HZI)]
MILPLSLAILITVVAILFSGLFSGCEIAFVQSSKVRMEIDAARGGMVDRIIKGFSRHEDMFISTLLVGNNVVLVIYGISFSVIVNPLFEEWFHHSEALTLISNTVFSTAVILLLGEFLPKTTFRINPNFMMRLLALPLYLIYLILYPVSWFVSVISKGLMKLCGLDTGEAAKARLTMDELDDYIQQSMEDRENGEAVENEVKIFRKAIDFKDTQISECMIPRNEIVAVPLAGTTREKLIKVFTATGLSKVVVYREDIDDVAGYIHISEMFNSTADWRRKLKPVIFTPETMLANKMMRRMMSEKRTLAMVVDEFGGTSGLVTLEDIVEEIFGEIEDEHDVKRLVARELPDGAYEFSGRMEISAINEDFGLDIRESEEYHTLSGYILESLQALPRQGDSFEIGDLAFRIEKMTTTRIELVRIEKKKDA